MPHVSVGLDHSFESLIGNNLKQYQVSLRKSIISLWHLKPSSYHAGPTEASEIYFYDIDCHSVLTCAVSLNAQIHLSSCVVLMAANLQIF